MAGEMFRFEGRPAPRGGTAEAALVRPGPEGHAGLWSDKYGPARVRDKDKHDAWPGQGTKEAWVGALAAERTTGETKWGNQALMTRTADQLKALAAARGGEFLTLETVEPVVIGIGLPHPLENGLLWHHTLAAPYVPGPSLKGMTRAWARDWLPTDKISEGGAPKPDVSRIFGEPEAGAGTVCFLDASPCRPIPLQVEAMTPHYGPYYGEAGSDDPQHWPGDWFSPTPIAYLAIAPGVTFATALLPRRGARHKGDVADVATALAWLSDAALFIGTGAKTSRGMGRMQVTGSATTQQKHQ